MTTMDPGARFRLVSGQELPSPGTCRGCGSGHRDAMDIGTDVWNGAILLCVDCLRNLVDSWPESGFVREEEYEVEVERNSELTACLDKLGEAKRRFRNATTTAMDDLDRYLLTDSPGANPIIDTGKEVKKPRVGLSKVAELPDIDSEFV